uniref:DUF418 domain-containing protein n=1 Tax=Ascaris lumbricoides TaxID=6252 RepID=A0A0M3IVR3_ASCLU
MHNALTRERERAHWRTIRIVYIVSLHSFIPLTYSHLFK